MVKYLIQFTYPNNIIRIFGAGQRDSGWTVDNKYTQITDTNLSDYYYNLALYE